MLDRNINLDNSTVLVTGAAGFIGAHLVLELLETTDGIKIVGLDNMNDYYDVSIKEYRLSEIEKKVAGKPSCEWTFIKGDISDRELIDSVFEKYRFDVVVNLAAQAGVRYSITNPDAYIKSNVITAFILKVSLTTKQYSTAFLHKKVIKWKALNQKN